ncbi:MAG: TonB family protein, partial [Prevotella sp.]|nr:TonB family protein [Prevotella sp.]
LLASVVLSLALPLCVVTVHRTVEVDSMPQPMASVGVPEVGEIVADEPSNTPATALAVVYLLGVAFCLARTSVHILSVRRLIARCREVPMPSYIHDNVGGMRLFVAEDENVKPFSWMRSVVLSRKDYEDDLADGARGHSIVLAHECGHVACRHSVDMLFVDLIVALQWFNPVVWLLRQDLRIVHEYEADARVLSQGFNAYQYLSLLVQKAAGDAGYSVANGISLSSIVSKRVIMMTKKQSSKYAWARLLYVVPIVALSLAATAKTVVDYQVIESKTSTEMTLPDDETLYVVDGNIVEKQDVKKLKTEEIQSIKILKKEEATSKWGTQGANGVIEITTDRTKVHEAVMKSDDDDKLYVVDGNIASKEIVDALVKEEIEAVSVLTGETATKLWGSKGANGVIMITTKGANVSEKAVAIDSVMQIPEEMPSFPGGVPALIEFLQKNVKYPVEAQKKGVEGRVVVSFVVEKDGSLTEIKTVRSVDPLLDEEAVRVVSAMPKWEPGKQKGKPVRVKYNVPISFKLTGSATKTDGQTAPALSPADAPTAQSSSEERIFEVVEKMPEFPGGAKALMEYISYNVRYPKEAQESGEQGRVIVGFIVEKDGTISNARVVRSNRFVLAQVQKDGGIVTKVETAEVSARHELETEALRVINAMPKWTPGKQNGNAV